MKLTKIDIAEAQIRAAVRMFFEGAHPVPVYTLANAAREIVGTIGNKTEVQTTVQDVAETMGVTTKELLRPLVSIANFFKHADRDADATLKFDEVDAEVMLQLACYDFHRVTGSGTTVEALTFQTWTNALFPKVAQAPLSTQNHIRMCIRLFPGIRRAADRAEQKKIGLAVLKKALAYPMMEEELKQKCWQFLLPSEMRLRRNIASTSFHRRRRPQSRDA